MPDTDFAIDAAGLRRAIDRLAAPPAFQTPDLALTLPEEGIGPHASLDRLAPYVLGGAAPLGEALSGAHMDPPTPWISWAGALWNAALNQNLLHPATAPAAREIEARVIGWIAPYFGMDGGHMTPGSTVSNLTALWAARERAGVRQVVAGDTAHLSIAKAAHLLGLPLRTLATRRDGSIDPALLPDDLTRSALVLTAGSTASGAIDPLEACGRAAWTHVDAAWAGPLRFSRRHASLLGGIERADSVAISAHKLLFQPKESALVLFRETVPSHEAVSFGGSYLAAPNIGLLGSHGAAAVPLLATLLAWGRQGLAERIDRCMATAEALAAALAEIDALELLCPPTSGVVVWRPRDGDVLATLQRTLPSSTVSQASIGGERWFRNVIANPDADAARIAGTVQACLRDASR